MKTIIFGKTDTGWKKDFNLLASNLTVILSLQIFWSLKNTQLSAKEYVGMIDAWHFFYYLPYRCNFWVYFHIEKFSQRNRYSFRSSFASANNLKTHAVLIHFKTCSEIILNECSVKQIISAIPYVCTYRNIQTVIIFQKIWKIVTCIPVQIHLSRKIGLMNRNSIVNQRIPETSKYRSLFLKFPSNEMFYDFGRARHIFLFSS